jgi:hypothetical protein
MKKLLVVGVIVLFLGFACAPSINANVSRDSELVEITTEICGLGGGKHTIQLTQEEAEELEQLIEYIEQKLDEVETREEAVEIFNDAVVKLDKYGLLGGLSVKQAQNLITRDFQKNKLLPVFKNLVSRFLESSDFENIFCLIFIDITKSNWIMLEINIPFLILLFLSFTELPLGMLLYIYYRIGGIRIFDMIITIFNIYSNSDTLNYYSLGSYGMKTGEVNGKKNLRLFGFTGLIIKYNIDNFLLSSKGIMLGTSFAFEEYIPQQYP